MPRAASLPHIRKEPLAAGGGGGHDSYAAAVTGVQVADNEELCTTEILDDILGGGKQDAEEQGEEQTRTGSTYDTDDSGDVDEDSIAPNTYARGDTDTDSSMASDEEDPPVIQSSL